MQDFDIWRYGIERSYEELYSRAEKKYKESNPSFRLRGFTQSFNNSYTSIATVSAIVVVPINVVA